MKKISLYILGLLTMGVVACSEDIPASSSPLSYAQERSLEAGDISFSPTTVTDINLPALIGADEPITLGTVAYNDAILSEGITLIAKIEMSKNADYSDSIFVEAESIGESKVVAVRPSSLQRQYYDNFTHDPATRTMYLRTHLYTVTGTSSEACTGDPKKYLGYYTVTFTPVKEFPHDISATYYAVVKKADGSGFSKVKFDHSKENIYDDPRFTVTIDATRDASNLRIDTEYGIVSEDDLAAFEAGDMSVIYGKEDKSSSIMKKGAPLMVGPATDFASKYNLTINMEFISIDIEDVILFNCYYLLGEGNMKIGDGDNKKNYMFYKQDETTFTYTTKFPNNAVGKSWLSVKVWDRDAMTNGAETKAWGYEGSGLKVRPMNGKMKLNGGLLGPETEGWYTMTITMDDDKKVHNYKFTSISEPTTKYDNISILVNGSDVDLKECAKAAHNWALLDYTLTSETKLKFRANHSDANTWGGDGSQPIGKYVYTLNTGTQDITVPAGKYDFYLNDITGDWTILKVE